MSRNKKSKLKTILAGEEYALPVQEGELHIRLDVYKEFPQMTELALYLYSDGEIMDSVSYHPSAERPDENLEARPTREDINGMETILGYKEDILRAPLPKQIRVFANTLFEQLSEEVEAARTKRRYSK